MLRELSAHKRAAVIGFWSPLSNTVVARLMIFLLFFGVLSGSISATYLTEESFFSPIPLFDLTVFSPGRAFSEFLNSGKYFFLLFLFSTSFFGILCVPVLVFLRGYALGYCVAELFCDLRYSGLLRAFLLHGVSAAITLPLFIFFAIHCFMRSKELFDFRFYARNYPRAASRSRLTAVLLPILVLIDTAYRCCVLPLLIP